MMYLIFLKNKKKSLTQAGDILLTVLVFSAIAITMTVALVNWGATLIKAMRQVANREQAFQIAEAGIDYYRWHLAHAPKDYTDGGAGSGPYTHQLKDKNGNVLGTYELTITPPLEGSTLVTIVSKGTLASNPSIQRSIKTVLGIPSWAQYSVVANDNMYFGPSTNTYGTVHSNKGIHFDGIAHGPVSSAVATYVDPDYNRTAFGVYTLTSPSDPTPPSAVPNRPDVFMAGRTFPIAEVDFSGLTSIFSTLKAAAQTAGKYLAPSQSGGLPAYGYHIVLKTNDTYDLYTVTALTSAPSGCTNSQSQTQWGTWSIQSQQLVGNYAFPANGVIYAEDHIWVDGTVSSARLTIAAGVLPDPGANSWPNITINNNLLYTFMNGTDSIGLIAQGNINVGLVSADNLTIDAALIAQNGRVGRYYYSSSCGANYIRSSLSLYGMIATNKRYGFAYSNGTGYSSRSITYDPNLLYSPPPVFPLSGDFYETLSWQEVTP